MIERARRARVEDPEPRSVPRTASRASSPAASGSASRWAARSSAIPKVFLFDEPLSNLDAKLRVAMRAEIKALHQRLKTTTVYVTHDQVEAMTMADRIVVMHDGRDRADRRAARALRPSGQSLRRAVHRLAGDERRQRHGAARQRRGVRRDGRRRALAAAAQAPAPTARRWPTASGPSDLDARPAPTAPTRCPARSSSSSRPAPRPSC